MNLFLDLDTTDTFNTVLERLEEYGADSVMFTVNNMDKKPCLFLCLTQNPELADVLGKAAEAYENEGEDA